MVFCFIVPKTKVHGNIHYYSQTTTQYSERVYFRHMSCSGNALVLVGIRVVYMYEEWFVPYNDVLKYIFIVTECVVTEYSIFVLQKRKQFGLKEAIKLRNY